MRRTIVWICCFVIVVVGFTSVGAPLWASWVGIPTEVRLFPGAEFSLDIQVPFRLSDATGSDVTGEARQFSFATDELGSQKYQVSLFGLIPVTEMVVDVVPLIRVYPGGQSIGVLVNAKGLIVSDVSQVTGIDGKEYHPARDGGIQPGDKIIAIEGQDVTRPEQVSQLVNMLAQRKSELEVVIMRNNRTYTRLVKPVRTIHTGNLYGEQRETYMIGIYLEDPAAGVGTLTFYDPYTRRFGALGHTVTDNAGRQMVIKGGSIVEASIDSVRYGMRGAPGEKLGFFHGEQDLLGSIDSNSSYGVFGTLTSLPVNNFFEQPIPVAFAYQVETGPAYIYTVLAGNEIEQFTINIERVSKQNRPGDKGLIIQITDSRLLRETGGIIQGMSGSPIVQNGMLVGVVTHVFVNDPTKGYGSFAEWMIYEAGLANDLPAISHWQEGFFLLVEKH